MNEGADETALVGLVDGKFSYKKRTDGSVDKSIVICKICHKIFAYHRSTSSLKYHLSAKHIAASVDVSPIPSTSRTHTQPTLHQMTGLRTRVTKSTSEKITNGLAHWIALDCRPLGVVEDKGLQNVLQIASSDTTYELPCRKTVTKRVQQLYDTEKADKENLLEKAECVALTGDHWTSVSNSNYLGVTAHFIDVKWRLHSFALTIQKTTARHFAENVAEDFESVAEAWEITQKVTTIGTDSARTMMAAMRQLTFQHMPCVAHVLQRTITVCLADSGFTATLAKCHKIVGHFKHSPSNTEELHKEQTQLEQDKEPLIQDVSTRWNSTLFMISRLLRNQEAVKLTLAKQKHKLTMLTTAEWDRLQRLETLLKPCRYVTELLGGETYVSCSVVLPALRHLTHIMEVSDDDPAYVVRFKGDFKKDLSQRQDTLNLGWLRVATALDPRFKDLKCLPRGEREGVWTNIEALLRIEPNRATPEPTEEPARKRSLLLFNSDSESEDEEAHKVALARYRAEPTISETDCPLQWWSTHEGAHPQLSALARKYLGSPATSVPCERLFSQAGNIVQKKRAALSSENVNRLVCLSNWLKEKEK
ncbi:E3 SUMO-protein ligase ZBED1-like [Misgurnus anguillicaudatus]|uniref:E3 SUMO-protein ligase ZBED1-like n=1 Tax=Misgurnus anguillicaudatus TaxID=75329 RepID=UPI003CCF806C